MNKLIYTLALLFIIMSSCLSKKTTKEKSDSLLNTLKSIQGKGILFGHQDDLAYGKNWKYVDGESDVKRVAGDYPAVFGWELGGLERGDLVNLDSVPFKSMKELALKAHKMGGINTFSWHPYSLVNGENSWNTDTTVVKHIVPGGDLHQEFISQLDLIASFFNKLKDKNNQSIQFIFRPWHEMGGAWFWWGVKNTKPEEYKALFRFTIDYLKVKKGLTNMLTCYSPNGGYQNADEYLTWYPGDEYVDMLGVDEYEWPNTTNWVSNTKKTLEIMIQVAQEKNKLAAFTETGCENLVDTTWFTNKLYNAISSDSIASYLSYVLVWRNDPKVHHFFSYEGHPSEADAKSFTDQQNILLLNDFNNLKK